MLRVKSPNTGREGDWIRIGFSPRMADLSLYLTGAVKQDADALKKLGKHKTGGGCIYINKVEGVDMKVLKGVIEASLKTEYFSK